MGYLESYFKDGLVSSFQFSFCFIKWVKVSLDFVHVRVFLF